MMHLMQQVSFSESFAFLTNPVTCVSTLYSVFGGEFYSLSSYIQQLSQNNIFSEGKGQHLFHA